MPDFNGGTIGGNLVPDITGRDLGSASYQFDAFIQDLTVYRNFLSKNFSSIRFADQFSGANVTAQIDAAITDLGANQGVIVIPSSMGAGAPTTVPNNAVILDLRKLVTLIGNPANINASTLHEIYAGTASIRTMGAGFQAHATAGGTGVLGADETVALFAAAERTGGTRPVWAINALASTAVTGNGGYCIEADYNAGYNSTVTSNASDQQVGVSIISGGTKNPLAGIQVQASTPATGAWLIGADIQNWKTYGVRIGAPVLTGSPNLYLIPQADDSNLLIEARNAADGSDTFTVQNSGNVVTTGLMKADHFSSPAASPAASGVVRLGNADGVNWRNQAGGGDLSLTVTSGDVLSYNAKWGVNSSGIISNYDNIATVANGVPAERAAVDLTAQAAAVGTTTLYAVPADGQFRLSWNAKVTTVDAVSSTLGALTIVYTDPDGVAQTITAGALVAAGTVATTSTGNTTAAVLLGIPLTMNCKSGTNITYAMAYVSNTPGSMKYNLHMRLESI